MMNSTQQNDANGGTPLAEPTGSKTLPSCPKCGNNRQVWKNQMTGKLTCHRAFCHTVISSDSNTGGQTRGGSRVV